EFQNFDIGVNGDFDNLENASVNVTIDVASISTGNDDRDGHLKSADFFDAENHPNITFVSKNIKKASDSEFEVTGDLTIRGTTNEETFTIDYNGKAKDPMQGNTIAGVDLEGKINREDYGLTWNAQLETGGVLVGKEVKFSGGFEFVVED